MWAFRLTQKQKGRKEKMKMQQNNEKLKPIINKIMEYGDVLLISQKGYGKTNSLMVLAKEFMELPDTRVFIFEDFPKFAVEFNGSLANYVRVLDNDVVETKDMINLNDYYLSHDKDFTVKRGSFYQQALENNRHLIFTMEIKDVERKAFFIYAIAQTFYRKAYLRAYKGYTKREHIIFVIEESQNAFAQATLNRKIFNRLHSIFNVARNLDLHFVLASQRFTDLNPKIRNRTQLLIGNIHIDDYELRIHRLLRHSKYRNKILTLKVGEFLFVPSDSIVKFPKFQNNIKPKEWMIPEKPKKKTIWQKIIEAIVNPNEVKKYEKRANNEYEKFYEDEQEEDELTEEIEDSYGELM